jgi:hypothetical protein
MLRVMSERQAVTSSDRRLELFHGVARKAWLWIGAVYLLGPLVWVTYVFHYQAQPPPHGQTKEWGWVGAALTSGGVMVLWSTFLAMAAIGIIAGLALRHRVGCWTGILAALPAVLLIVVGGFGSGFALAYFFGWMLSQGG